MSPQAARRLWESSRGDASGARAWLRRARFMVLAWRHHAAMRAILEARPGSLLHSIAAQRPAVFGFTRAPYLVAAWRPAARFAEYVRHAETADTIGALMNFAPDLSVELMTLEEIGPGYHIVLDKPEWMFREGLVTLNLFRDNLRLFSLTFSFCRDEGDLSAIVGGLQGRSLPGILDAYRDLTKAAHGLRPRDLTVELFRLFCAANGVVGIRAVSNAGRIHQGELFKAKHYASLNYDEAWTDRGGVRLDDDFFELPLEREVRAERDIPQKKRAMYRRRYDLLAIMEDRMKRACADPLVTRRPAAE